MFPANHNKCPPHLIPTSVQVHFRARSIPSSPFTRRNPASSAALLEGLVHRSRPGLPAAGAGQGQPERGYAARLHRAVPGRNGVHLPVSARWYRYDEPPSWTASTYGCLPLQVTPSLHSTLDSKNTRRYTEKIKPGVKSRYLGLYWVFLGLITYYRFFINWCLICAKILRKYLRLDSKEV